MLFKQKSSPKSGMTHVSNRYLIIYLSILIKKIFILPIRFYQYAISPLLGQNCRYSPTCSHYMVQAIEEWGVLKGIWLGTKRIFRCHPWAKHHGHDPVPKKGKKTSTRVKK